MIAEVVVTHAYLVFQLTSIVRKSIRMNMGVPGYCSITAYRMAIEEESGKVESKVLLDASDAHVGKEL